MQSQVTTRGSPPACREIEARESQSGRLTPLRLAGLANPPTALDFSVDGKLLAVGVGETDGEVVAFAANPQKKEVPNHVGG